MSTAGVAINVHIRPDTALVVHRTSTGRVWLEIGDGDTSMALFLGRDDISRLIGVLRDANTEQAPPTLRAA